MGSSPSDALKGLVMLAACALTVTACGGDPSYQTAAMQASDSGDRKSAVSLAKKEVARFSEPDQCSRANNLNCGTLALAYGTLANYQIMDGDHVGGEESFIGAKGALSLTDPAIRSSATGIVYRDVSEAYWNVGARARATAVFNEGRAAGGDMYLYMSSAGRAAAAAEQPVPQPSPQPVPQPDPQPTDQKLTD